MIPPAQAAVSSRCAEVVRHGQQRRTGRSGVRILRAPALEPGASARPAGPAVARAVGLYAAEAGRGPGTWAPPAAAGGAAAVPSSGGGAVDADGSAVTGLGAEGSGPGRAEGSQPGDQNLGQAQARAEAEEGEGQRQPGASGREQLGGGLGQQAGTGAAAAAMEVDLQAPRIGGGKKRKKARRGSAQGRGTQGWQQTPG